MRFTILVGGAIGASILASTTVPLGCNGDVRSVDDAPTYRGEVAAILDARCTRCHGEDAPAGGFRANSYAGAIGCTASGAVVVLPKNAPPLLLALTRPDHLGFATDAERATLGRWIDSDAQSVHAGVHPRSFADPRSPSGHAAVLRGARYRALTDPNDADACARCHDGAGARPSTITSAAAGATACTTCHTDPGGVNACSTCHGAPGRPYPPRDPCFYPNDPKRDPHAAHAGPSRSRAVGLDCAVCHSQPIPGVFTGPHADGYVEVAFDHAVTGPRAEWNAALRSCTGTCHDHGGTNPTPVWISGEAALDCNGCHTSPPKNHFAGSCTTCHVEANATGTALTAPVLHSNGRVDLGAGGTGCGACHGSGTNPWPTTGAHPAHETPANAAPVVCETCHAVPGPNDLHPRGGDAVVHLAGLATKGGAPATYDSATKGCSSTYCHDGPGAANKTPHWNDGAPAVACGGCHATPPPPPHSAETSCGTSSCHEGVTSGTLTISTAGRAVHVNGRVDRHVTP